MNTFGTLFKVTLYGESHQKAIGILIDGMPSGIKIETDLIKEDLAKRAPGAIGTTPRIEKDEVEILSGVFNEYSTGSPIHLMIKNLNTKSDDYLHLINQPRPGHADFVSKIKYHGFQDYRGGGRFSGRLTAALVAGGAVAKMTLPFQFKHELTQVGEITDMSKLDAYLEKIAGENDSVGGTVKLTVSNIPVGLGEPFFHKVESLVGQMLFSIPAVKGVSFGTGFEGKHLKGSAFNDVIINAEGKTKTNHSGGVSGGITNGNDLIVNVFVKPTSSIQKEQESYHLVKNEISSFTVKGRHDVAIIRRIGIVLENALAIVLADLYLLNRAYAK